MSTWSYLTVEERTLLNPAFIAIIIWNFYKASINENSRGLTFAESFLVVPFILNKKVRQRLPNSVSTSLPVWIEDNQDILKLAIDSLPRTHDTTRASLSFGGELNLIKFAHGTINANLSYQRPINGYIKKSSTEVQECFRKANFLGRWFIDAGDAANTLRLLGIKP